MVIVTVINVENMGVTAIAVNDTTDIQNVFVELLYFRGVEKTHAH